MVRYKSIFPSPSNFCIFDVVGLSETTNSYWVGKASWVPKNNYSEGDWGNFIADNGGEHKDIKILFWRQRPTYNCDEPKFEDIIKGKSI